MITRSHHIHALRVILCKISNGVAIRDGDVFDSWDSTREIPQFYWSKEA